jgi:uncharacterized protein with von Willebrand factor type A (vWA) domain
VRRRLHEFIDVLRDAGLGVSVAEGLDAMRAVAAIPTEREMLREALAATLIKDHAERAAFDALFDRFFALPARPRSQSKHPLPGTEGHGEGRGTQGTRGTPPMHPSEARNTAGQIPVEHASRRVEHRGDAAAAAQRLAATQRLQRIPFESLSPADIDACDELVEELARRFRAHLSRRLRAAHRGRLDVRRTVRRGIGTGGVLIEPVFRHRRPGRPDLIALCDHSHSVAVASRFFLALLLPAEHIFRRVRSFAYVDEPVEVTLEGGHVIPHTPLDLHARSDFGKVLARFWERYHPLLTRNTLLLILGDARNNRRPPRADLLARMRTSVRQVIWLNPETPSRWNTADSVMATYRPHCDVVIAAGNLRELSSALARVFSRFL